MMHPAIALLSKNTARSFLVTARLAAVKSLLTFVCLCATRGAANAQLSFNSSINLALQNSPRVKIGEDDVHRAAASLSEMKDVFTPSVMSSGGAGSSYGITLSVPTIFTISAQSLVFNYSQRDYIRSAHAALAASELTLSDVRSQVEEDTAITYVGLNNARMIAATLAEEYRVAIKLTGIVTDRQRIGLESPLSVQQTRRSLLQIKLRRLETEDQVAQLGEHLAQLMGLQGTSLFVVPESIPSLAKVLNEEEVQEVAFSESASLQSAEANARSKQERAFGDSRYAWRPQVAFFAQYGRVSPINGVTDYYNIHGNYNTASAGVSVQIPFLDAVHKARAEESLADASRAFHETSELRAHEMEDHLQLRHSIAELSIRADLASVDQLIAQEQLNATLLELQSNAYPGPPKTPKDEQNARLEERQRYADTLEAEFQLEKAKIYLLRQTGQLESWINSREILTK